MSLVCRLRVLHTLKKQGEQIEHLIALSMSVNNNDLQKLRSFDQFVLISVIVDVSVNESSLRVCEKRRREKATVAIQPKKR